MLNTDLKYRNNEVKLSLTLLAEKNDIKRADLLTFLINKGLVSDIRTITKKGLENGVEYRFSDDKSAKWPVYGKVVQDLIDVEYGKPIEDAKVSEIKATHYDYIIEKVCEHIHKNNQVLKNRIKLHAVLLDFFSGDTIIVRRLFKGYDLGIIDYIENNSGGGDIAKSFFLNKLVNSEDLQIEKAIEIYDFWLSFVTALKTLNLSDKGVIIKKNHCENYNNSLEDKCDEDEENESDDDESENESEDNVIFGVNYNSQDIMSLEYLRFCESLYYDALYEDELKEISGKEIDFDYLENMKYNLRCDIKYECWQDIWTNHNDEKVDDIYNDFERFIEGKYRIL